MFSAIYRWIEKNINFVRKKRNPIEIIDGTIHSPYFIFIRCTGKYSDRELLSKFELNAFHRAKYISLFDRCIYITEDINWIHIADDDYYTLWHMSSIRDSIKQIANDHDVFLCWVGDIDRSYGFTYYSQGNLVRQYVVECQGAGFDNLVVTENLGKHLPGENKALKVSGEFEKVLSIAKSLGINMRHDAANIRVYAKKK